MPKMTKKNLKQTKESVSKVLVQAIEAMGTIREKFPTAEVRKKLTNDRIVEGLSKIGVATRAELKELRARIDELEARLDATLGSARPTSGTRRSSTSGPSVRE